MHITGINYKLWRPNTTPFLDSQYSQIDYIETIIIHTRLEGSFRNDKHWTGPPLDVPTSTYNNNNYADNFRIYDTMTISLHRNYITTTNASSCTLLTTSWPLPGYPPVPKCHHVVHSLTKILKIASLLWKSDGLGYYQLRSALPVLQTQRWALWKMRGDPKLTSAVKHGRLGATICSVGAGPTERPPVKPKR